LDIGYWVKSHFTGRPFLVERDDLISMRNTVEKILRENQIDAIHADQLSMAQFAFRPKNKEYWPISVFDAHNAVWTIVDRSKDTAILPLKPILELESKRIQRYECRIISKFDNILAVSAQDKKALMQACVDTRQEYKPNAQITVIPITVDTDELTPINRENQSKNILTLGTLHYPPNADGIRWFAQEVFPLILHKMPDAQLTIVGKNPPADFIQMAKEKPNKISVTGYIPDLTPCYKSSAVVVVPVRAGGGIKVRILEAFALGMPVVTTKVGLEGIKAKPDVDVLVADDAQTFAVSVIELLSNPEKQKQLSQNGRFIAETHYHWQRALSKLESIYG
jgi:glycosyltransferase involved in cell wall biosynthesis